jgi:hypothetical protein
MILRNELVEYLSNVNGTKLILPLINFVPIDYIGKFQVTYEILKDEIATIKVNTKYENGEYSKKVKVKEIDRRNNYIKVEI